MIYIRRTVVKTSVATVVRPRNAESRRPVHVATCAGVRCAGLGSGGGGGALAQMKMRIDFAAENAVKSHSFVTQNRP
jgi:hypothetical protein